jgi:hypothetical protein
LPVIIKKARNKVPGSGDKVEGKGVGNYFLPDNQSTQVRKLGKMREYFSDSVFREISNDIEAYVLPVRLDLATHPRLLVVGLDRQTPSH